MPLPGALNSPLTDRQSYWTDQCVDRLSWTDAIRTREGMPRLLRPRPVADPEGRTIKESGGCASSGGAGGRSLLPQKLEY